MSVYFTRRGFSGVKKGIESVSLSYPISGEKELLPTVVFYPADADAPKSLNYEITSGFACATINPSTGVLTLSASGAVVVSLTVVDANGKAVSTSATVNLAVWQKWNVATIYDYPGTYTKRSNEANSLFWWLPSSGDYLFFSKNMPSIRKGITTEKNAGYWIGLEKTSVRRSDFPFTIVDSGFYAMPENTPGTYNDLYYIREGTTIRYETHFVYANQETTEYDADIYTESKAKGNTNYGAVYAAAGTYPENGEKAGYWYVKV